MKNFARFLPHSNAGRIWLTLPCGLFVCVCSGLWALFGCFEIWASCASAQWPKFHYAGLVVLAVLKLLGLLAVILAYRLRLARVTRLLGWAALFYVVVSVIWLIICWAVWNADQKSSDWEPPAWEKVFFAAETIFTLAGLVLLWWTLTALWSSSRIQRVGGSGFEGRDWRRVVEYLKTRNAREAARLVKADNWLAEELALDQRHREQRAEADARRDVRKRELKEERDVKRADRKAEKQQAAAEKKARQQEADKLRAEKQAAEEASAAAAAAHEQV